MAQGRPKSHKGWSRGGNEGGRLLDNAARHEQLRDDALRFTRPCSSPGKVPALYPRLRNSELFHRATSYR